MSGGKKEEKHEDGAPEEGGGGKKSKKKLIAIVGALVILLGGGGAGAYFFMSKKKDAHAEEATEEGGEHGDKDKSKSKDKGKSKKAKDEKEGGDKHAKEAPKDAHGKPPEIKGLSEGPDGVAYYELPSFLVNLNTGDSKRSSFLKITVSLELESKEEAPGLELIKPRLIDTFNTYLRELRPADVHGSSGIYKMREELLLRTNQLTDPVKVSDLLFKEVIIQ